MAWAKVCRSVNHALIRNSFRYRCPYNNCASYSPYARGIHGGNDIDGYTREPVRAAHGGEVIFVGRSASLAALGKMVVVRYWSRSARRWRFHRYCHLDSIKVRKGQRVRKAQILGACGDTGLNCPSGCAHVHMEWSQAPKGSKKMPAWSDVTALLDPNSMLRAAQ